MLISSLITERGEPPRQLFIGRGGYSATQSALITERGEPPRRLFIGRGDILHHATRSHHRERRATKAALHRERRGLRRLEASLSADGALYNVTVSGGSLPPKHST